jgi:hypothetical protein
MASILITNISGAPLPLSDLGSKTLAVNEAVTIQRPAGFISSMRSLIAALAAGSITVLVTPTAEEIASGLLTPPQAVQPVDMAAVASTDVAAVEGEFRKAFAAGGGGSADDVTIFAANNFPYKVRITGMRTRVKTGVSGATVVARTAAAGGGTALGTCDAEAAGTTFEKTGADSVVVTPGTLVGLFIRRSDSGVAGEVYLSYRRES